MAQTKTKSKSRKKAAPPNILNIAFVWDMSGSMGTVKDATIEGTSAYLSDLQKEEGKLSSEHGEDIFTRFSLTAFDTVFEQWIVDEPVSSIDVAKTVDHYQPRGWTALYDAIANTIIKLEASLKGDRENEKCLVVVMTDGQENSSVEYGGPNGRKKIFDLIKSYEAKGNWTFVYLGANVDAFAEASSIGIPTGNAAYYSSTPGSVTATAASLSNVTATRRAGVSGQTVTAFNDAEESQDYRDEVREQFDSSSATNVTRKIR